MVRRTVPRPRVPITIIEHFSSAAMSEITSPGFPLNTAFIFPVSYKHGTSRELSLSCSQLSHQHTPHLYTHDSLNTLSTDSANTLSTLVHPRQSQHTVHRQSQHTVHTCTHTTVSAHCPPTVSTHCPHLYTHDSLSTLSTLVHTGQSQHTVHTCTHTTVSTHCPPTVSTHCPPTVSAHCPHLYTHDSLRTHMTVSTHCPHLYTYNGINNIFCVCMFSRDGDSSQRLGLVAIFGTCDLLVMT